MRHTRIESQFGTDRRFIHSAAVRIIRPDRICQRPFATCTASLPNLLRHLFRKTATTLPVGGGLRFLAYKYSDTPFKCRPLPTNSAPACSWENFLKCFHRSPSDRSIHTLGRVHYSQKNARLAQMSRLQPGRGSKDRGEERLYEERRGKIVTLRSGSVCCRRALLNCCGFVLATLWANVSLPLSRRRYRQGRSLLGSVWLM